MNIIVTVGTSKFKFNRFLNLVVDFFGNFPISDLRLHLQVGFSDVPDTQNLDNVSVVNFLDVASFELLISGADGVICHSAAGTIFQCASNGIVPLVLPRLFCFGEHSDDHQAVSAQTFERLGLCRIATFNESDFHFLLSKSRGVKRRLSGVEIDRIIDCI
jgi:UDP-N-acetylglucosamine transferase subunit ALG13